MRRGHRLVACRGLREAVGLVQILERRPSELHERLPVFVGSSDDVDELLSYGDVQQVGDFKYDAVG